METSHSVGKNLVANTLTTMFTVPSRTRVHWNMLYAVNHTASAKNFSAWWYDASEGVSVTIVESYPISSKNYFLLDGNAYIVLDEGDQIQVKSETGSTCSCLVTLEIENKPTVQKFL